MKRLLILRHAKAVPHDEPRDKQRDLSVRGRDDAERMGRVMNERGYVPALVLCSSAKRTTETWTHAAPALGGKPSVEFLDSLYDASETAILKIVRAVKKSAPVVLCIGHNPGLEQFAHLLARRPANADERRLNAALAENFPTAALAVLDFDIDGWAAVAPAAGTLHDFLTPKGLKAN